MAYNWNVVVPGAIYVAKGGDDVTGDGSELNPYETIQEGLNNGGTVVVGAGRYDEQVSRNGSYTCYADGEVEMNGIGFGAGSAFGVASQSSQSVTLNGQFKVHDYPSLALCLTLTIDGGEYYDMTDGNVTGSSRQMAFTNCVFRNIGNFYMGGTVQNNNIRNVNFIDCGRVDMRLVSRVENCIFLNCNNIWFSDNLTVGDYNCIRNCTEVRHYDVTSAQIPNSPFANLAAYQADPLTGTYNDNSVDVDPNFNATGRPSSPDDYLLNPGTSTLIFAGKDGKQIGKFFQGLSSDGLLNQDGANGFLSTAGGATHSAGVSVDGNGVITITSFPATIESAEINLAAGGLVNPLGRIVAGLDQEYSSSEAIDSNDDDEPNRATIKMRHTQDNSGDPLSGKSYQLFVIGEQPTVDLSGRGNGNKDFVETEATPISATHIQFFIDFIDTHTSA